MFCIAVKQFSQAFVSETERCTKAFLVQCHIVKHAVHGTKRKKVGWVAFCDLASLLNIAEAAELFGPMPLCLEGKFDGEEFVECVKSECKKHH